MCVFSLPLRHAGERHRALGVLHSCKNGDIGVITRCRATSRRSSTRNSVISYPPPPRPRFVLVRRMCCKQTQRRMYALRYKSHHEGSDERQLLTAAVSVSSGQAATFCLPSLPPSIVGVARECTEREQWAMIRFFFSALRTHIERRDAPAQAKISKP